MENSTVKKGLTTTSGKDYLDKDFSAELMITGLIMHNSK